MENKPERNVTRRQFGRTLAGLSGAWALGLPGGLDVGTEETGEALYAVSNFHPGCMGWLAPYHVERNYCLYSYLDHQDRVLRDPNYNFAFSEIPHLITMMELEPGRFEELKGLVKKGRIELVNAFVVEPTINLSGGEALVMQGVEGIRWYQQIMKTKPRHCWMIDICGWHEQMAQIVTGLGLDSFVYTRYNPLFQGKAPSESSAHELAPAMHWIESADGTRALALQPGGYAGTFREAMEASQPLPEDQLMAMVDQVFQTKRPRYPQGMPLLSLAGTRDYSLSFRYEGYPREMFEVWEAARPKSKLRFSTLSEWFDLIKPGLDSGRYQLQTVKSGSERYGWTAFWVNAPAMKQRYRRAEHGLQSAESIATVASLTRSAPYPSQDFSHAWFMMALNMDRALLWGVAVDGVFSHPKGWDTRDRLEAVESIAAFAAERAMTALRGSGREAIGLFNSTNWPREGVFEVTLPAGTTVEDAPTQALGDGRTALLRTSLPPLGVKSFKLKKGVAASPSPIELPDSIETRFYSARVDPRTGTLISLKLKPAGQEMLGGVGNVVCAARVKPGSTIHDVPIRSSRKIEATSSDDTPVVTTVTGPLATVVQAVCRFAGGRLRRTMRFYNDLNRVDFETETEDLPPGTVVWAEFPFVDDITEIRRGIPYGFSHGAWSKPNPNLTGINKGIVPVIRWSHYSFAGGGGAAILDRGVPARELAGKTVSILLHNTNDRYYWGPAEWMSGKGRQTFQYALVAHETGWERENIARMAWEYNAPPVVLAAGVGSDRSFLETSDNVIVEAVRRVEDEVELRMVECKGEAGRVELKLALPFRSAALTNLLGEGRVPLHPTSSGDGFTRLSFSIRPQQIVTVRLKAHDCVPPVLALKTFDPLVPESKRAFTRGFKHPELKGHPPGTGVPAWKAYEE